MAGLLEEDRPDDAISLLESALEADEAEPVDHAWLTVQYARALAEVGRSHEARTLAAGVQSLRATHPDDVTATALAGVAAQLLFDIADWGEGDLAGAIMGADTAASWWRQQTRSWGLSAALERTFQQWARDTTKRWSVSDAANDQLLAASLTATVAGSRDAWRDVTGLLGRDALIRLTRNSDPAEAAAGLSTLRLAGQQEALKLAARRLVSDGPALAVTQAAGKVDLGASTRTTGPSNLTLLAEAGSVLEEATANGAVAWLLSNLKDASVFVARTSPSYWVELRLLETLQAVAASASTQTRRSLAEHILRLEPVQDELLARTWARLVEELGTAWTDADARELAVISDGHDERLRLALLGAAAPYNEEVRAVLLQAVRSGSSEALHQFGDVRVLPPDVVEFRVSACTEALASIAAMAENGAFGVGSDDPADELTLLSMWHADAAHWDALLAFLGNKAVSGRDKFRALMRMARQIELVPDVVRPKLSDVSAELAQEAAASPSDRFLGGRPSAPGAAALLGASLGLHGDVREATDLHRLLAGNDGDRVWAARIARQRRAAADVGVLTALVHDDSPQVRAAAAVGLADMACCTDGGALVEGGLSSALVDPGVTVPIAVAVHLAVAESLNAFGRTALSQLQSHAHVSVRRSAGV